MAKKARPARPKDTNQLAKYIADIATGQIKDDKTIPEKKKKDKA
jgi:hypothetical protein